jgi:hypothetical protein
MLGTAIHIGAQVKHVTVTLKCWHRCHYGRPINPLQHAQHTPPYHHQRTGIAGTDAGICLTIGNQLQRNTKGAILTFSQRMGRFFIHGNNAVSLNRLQPFAHGCGDIMQVGSKGIGLADQLDGQTGVSLKRLNGGGNRNAGTEVPAHRINRNGTKAGQA